jgi:hypothetical protein
MGKGHKPEEIIAKLRQVKVMTGQGTSMADTACARCALPPENHSTQPDFGQSWEAKRTLMA